MKRCAQRCSHYSLFLSAMLLLPQTMMLMLLFLALLGSVVSQTQVDTIYGTVEGLRDNHDGRDFDKFIGVPFAEPPVGDLRWRKPERPAAWDDVYMADEDRGTCTQLGFVETSEDCLYLSVYVPDGVENVQDLPVMVWIHGGAYFLGSHWTVSPEDLIMHGDIIYVGINYRLGNLGFLSSNDDASPGNYGLWDQAAALQWVNENIQAFGGDPDRITAFGQSAGGSSVSHMLISPHSNQYITGGIALSGGSSSNFGTIHPNNAVQAVTMLNHIFKCEADDDDHQAIIDCLRLEDAETIDFWSFVGFLIYHQQLAPFLPIVDGDFIAEHPQTMWANGAALEEDIITGHLHHDFAGFILGNLNGNYSEFSEDGGFASTSEGLDIFLSFLLNSFGNVEELKGALYEEYPELLSDDTLTRTIAATDAGTDWTFGSAAHFEALQHVANNGKSTWVYDLHYRQSFFQYPEWVEGSHGDDLYSVFGEVNNQEYREQLGEFDDADHDTKDYTMSYFTNFAYTGNPNEGPHVIDVTWDPYVNLNMMTIKNNPDMRPVSPGRANHYRWWFEEWPLITEPNDFTNYNYSDIPFLDCEPGLPIDEDCLGQILPNISLPFPPSEQTENLRWLESERTLAGGLVDLVKFLQNAWSSSNTQVWEAFQIKMNRAVAKREQSLLKRFTQSIK